MIRTPRALRAGIAAAILFAAAAARAESTIALDIESGPMLSCLEAIALAGQVRIVDASTRAAGAQCAALRGRFTLAQALDHVLAPAALAWHRTPDGTIEIIAAAQAPTKRERLDLATLDIEADALPEVERPKSPAPTELGERAQSLTRLDERWLDSAPLLGFDQIGRYAPNVYGNGQSLAIRGIERDSDFFTALSVSLDGIDLGTRLLDDELVPLDDLTRLDLARGPRAFEAGADAAAGAIRLATADPAVEPGLRALAGVGDHGAWRTALSWSGPLAQSGIGATLALSHRATPDFIDQHEVPQAERGARRNDSARAKVRLEPERFDGFSAEVSALNLSGDSSDRWIQAPTRNPDGTLPDFDLFDRSSFAPNPLVARTHARGIAGVARYERERWSLEVKAANTAIDRDGFEFPQREVEHRELENRRRYGATLHAEPIAGWKVVAGAEAADADTRLYTIDTVALQPPAPPYPGQTIDPATDVVVNQGSLFFSRTDSGWLWLEHEWGGSLSTGAGLRWLQERDTTESVYDQRLSDPNCRLVGPAPGQSRPCTDFVAVATRIRIATVRVRIPIPLAVIEWHPTPDHSIALSHGRGYRSAGSVANGPYGAEREESTELSWRAKWLDGRLETTAIAFDGKARDRFVYPIDPGQGFNSANARFRGLEFEASAALSDRWRVRAGLGLLDSRYIEYRDLDGQHTAGSPPQTLTLGARYGAAEGWYGAVDAYHAGATPTPPVGTQPMRRPAYSLLDARLGFRTSRWDAALIATNVLDADYVQRIEAVSTPNGTALRYRLGDPRRVELRISWNL